jgi:hypothetical protein
MSLSANKILLANAATNTAGAYIQPQSLGNATAIIPAGFYQVLATANVTIEMNTSNNISSPTWVVSLANNTSGLIISDGVNFRANVLSGTPTITLYATNGGQAASGTYNS